MGGSHSKIPAMCLFLEQKSYVLLQMTLVFCRTSQPQVGALHLDHKLKMKGEITHFSVCLF